MLPEVRGALRRRARRLRTSGWAIAQTTLAATVAWALASLIHDQPFFAPISAVIALGVARGRRTVRAFELALGVAVGIAVADLIVLALGTGTLVIAVVVCLAMLTALLLGAGTILVNQAAISAILVATLTPPSGGLSPDRFVDALIGGAVALLVGQVLFPRDPVRGLAEAARPVVGDLARALEAAAQALADGDAERARRAVALSEAVDADLAGFLDAVTLARETLPVLPSLSPRERLPAYAQAARQLDDAVRNTRVLTRRVVATVEDGAAAPQLAAGVELLAAAVRELGRQLEEPGHEVEMRRLALRAAVTASAVLPLDPGLSSVVIVGQVRSTAIDLMRGSGLDFDEAREALEAAAEDRERPTEVAMRTVPRPGGPRG
jgi:uncharacterized membrane protein YccC